MQLPSADKDALMRFASSRVWPTAPVRSTLSSPARSAPGPGRSSVALHPAMLLRPAAELVSAAPILPPESVFEIPILGLKSPLGPGASGAQAACGACNYSSFSLHAAQQLGTAV
jgi:hypothetical protein